jgi:hypothetical protein
MDVDEICRRNPSPLAAGQPCEQRSSSRKRCYRASDPDFRRRNRKLHRSSAPLLGIVGCFNKRH